MMRFLIVLIFVVVLAFTTWRNSTRQPTSAAAPNAPIDQSIDNTPSDNTFRIGENHKTG